jgi:putative toxin-antitoxin system antitoxin component (TIGR02293 family)
MILMLEPRHIGEVLGGRRVLGKPVTSLLELNDAVERGLPKATLRNVARHVFADAAEQRAMMHRIVPEATFKRRRERLSPAESERTERLARVVATAEDVWQDREQARRFLTTPVWSRYSRDGREFMMDVPHATAHMGSPVDLRHRAGQSETPASE